MLLSTHIVEDVYQLCAELAVLREFVVDAFQPGHIIYKIKYRQRRIHGKLLRQIADTPAHLLPLLFRVKSALRTSISSARNWRY